MEIKVTTWPDYIGYYAQAIPRFNPEFDSGPVWRPTRTWAYSSAINKTRKRVKKKKKRTDARYEWNRFVEKNTTNTKIEIQI